MVTSLANAWLDRTPMVVIAGSGPMSGDETNTLQAGLDQVAMAKPVTKWAHRVIATDQIPRLLEQAIRIATTAPRGPVVLDIPWDVLTGVEELGVPASHTNFGAPVAACGVGPAVELLLQAKRPVIVVGGEIPRGQGADALARFCEVTGVPAVADFEGLAALEALPDGAGCGLLQGLFGLGENAPDVVVMAGIRFGLTTAHGSGILIPETSRIIQIDPDARELGRLQAIEIGLVGEVAASVGALADAAIARGTDRDRLQGWRDNLGKYVAARFERLAKTCEAAPTGRLHPFVASRVVCEVAAPGNVVVADGALTYLWLSETIARSRPSRFLCHGYLGAMGVGFGTALGAQKAAGEQGKRAILVTGDGAVGYALAEFDTALRNDLPLIVVVMNNESWGATQHFQKMTGGPNRVTKTMLPNGRYHEVAEALNCKGYLVTDEEGLREALTKALAENVPACINVQVDLDEIPPEERVIMGGTPFDDDK